MEAEVERLREELASVEALLEAIRALAPEAPRPQRERARGLAPPPTSSQPRRARTSEENESAILRTLDERGPLRVTTLARASGVSPGSIGSVVERMEDRGQVVRAIHQRAVWVRLPKQTINVKEAGTGTLEGRILEALNGQPTPPEDIAARLNGAIFGSPRPRFGVHSQKSGRGPDRLVSTGGRPLGFAKPEEEQMPDATIRAEVVSVNPTGPVTFEEDSGEKRYREDVVIQARQADHGDVAVPIGGEITLNVPAESFKAGTVVELSLAVLEDAEPVSRTEGQIAPEPEGTPEGAPPAGVTGPVEDQAITYDPANPAETGAAEQVGTPAATSPTEGEKPT